MCGGNALCLRGTGTGRALGCLGQPSSLSPAPCPLHQSPAAAPETAVGISSSSSSSTSCWKWASSSSPGPWEASLPTLGLPGAAGGGWAQPHPSLWLCLLPQPGWPDLALPPAPGLFGAATLSPDSAAEKPRRDLSRSQSQAPETKCAR